VALDLSKVREDPMQYRYQPLEPGIPLAPIIPVQLTRPDWQTPLRSTTIAAFLDTGSDCTLVPLAVISSLQLQVSRSNAIVQGIGGEAEPSIAAYLNLAIGDTTIKAVKVYGYSGDLLDNQIILGRNILNQCCIEFDAIHQKITFKAILPE
jgi:predicted aspartyl protease